MIADLMEFQKYKRVQEIAKLTLLQLKNFIRVGVTEKEIAEHAEALMREQGVSRFWYHNVAALVLAGERTTLSLSGRDYTPSDEKIEAGCLVTIDLSPTMDGCWGDFARSYVVEKEETFFDSYEGNGILSEGLRAEHLLHKKLTESAKETSTFEDIFFSMNQFIDQIGFKNLDFKGNLGHSIERQVDDRKYLEEGEKTYLAAVDFFTFEPHIQHKSGGPGFKRENIYFFNNGKIEEL